MTYYLQEELQKLNTEVDGIVCSLRAELIKAERRRIPLTERKRETFGRKLLRIKECYDGLDPFIGEFENSSFNPGRYSEGVHNLDTAMMHAANLLRGGLIKEIPRQDVVKSVQAEIIEPSETQAEKLSPPDTRTDKLESPKMRAEKPEPSKTTARLSEPKLPSLLDDPLELTPKGLLIDMFVSPDRAPDMVFNLQRAFDERWTKVHGARVARLIFLIQSIGVILNFWTAWLLKRAGLLELFRPSQ